MKNIILFVVMTAFLACNLNKSNQQEQSASDSLNNQTIGTDDRLNDSLIYCFEYKKINISGNDTTTITNSITLAIKGSDVSGSFTEHITGKFSESYGGKIKGTKANEILKLQFITDMGGGEESQDYDFKLEEDKLIEISKKLTDKKSEQGSVLREFAKIVCG